MCKKAVLNINIDATLVNLSHSAKKKSRFTVSLGCCFLVDFIS